jgi:hypothetical protein
MLKSPSIVGKNLWMAPIMSVFQILWICETHRSSFDAIYPGIGVVGSIASLYSTFQLSPENTPSGKIAGFTTPTAEQLT